MEALKLKPTTQRKRDEIDQFYQIKRQLADNSDWANGPVKNNKLV